MNNAGCCGYILPWCTHTPYPSRAMTTRFTSSPRLTEQAECLLLGSLTPTFNRAGLTEQKGNSVSRQMSEIPWSHRAGGGDGSVRWVDHWGELLTVVGTEALLTHSLTHSLTHTLLTHSLTPHSLTHASLTLLTPHTTHSLTLLTPHSHTPYSSHYSLTPHLLTLLTHTPHSHTPHSSLTLDNRII